MNIKEDPIDNRQQHLDAMCFHVQFPDGRFGKYHPREVKISHSVYDKERLRLVSEKTHSMCFTCCGKNRCRCVQSAKTVYA